MRFVFSLIFVLVFVISPVRAQEHAPLLPRGYDAEELVSIKPELREKVAASLPVGMTEYEIEISIPEIDESRGAVIDGWQRVTVTNTTDDTLTELPFRLYANGAHHDRNAIEIDSVLVGGRETSFEMSVADSVATVPLGSTLAPGEKVEIEMTFAVAVPVDEASHYGLLNHSSNNDTTVLAHWYPVLAGRDPDTGWMLKPSSLFGDPIFSDAGMYDVTITAPTGVSLITSGVETGRASEGEFETVTFNAKPSRDFVIVMSETMQSVETTMDGTVITSWFQPHHRQGGEAVLGWTSNAIEVFNPLLGEYPWLELQAIEAVVYNAAAVELPQMFIMGSSFYNASDIGQPVSYFEFTVAHEVVHMWFYSIVGNNQYDDAYIDEGLTNYLSGNIYFREVYGEETGDAAHQTFLYRPFQRMIEGNSDVIVDHPTDDFPTSSAYVSAVYTKAPMGFHAIRMAMGDDAFFAGLQSYVAEFAWRVATPADLETAFQAQTEVNIREIWSHWFERREGGLDIRGDYTQWIA